MSKDTEKKVTETPVCEEAPTVNPDAQTPGEAPDSEEPVYEGEVVGYDLSALIGTLLNELQEAQEKQHISMRCAFISASVLKDWGASLLQQGITTVQLPEGL